MVTSLVFDRATIQVMLDRRKRAVDRAAAMGVRLAFSVYDALAQGLDARTTSDRWRGQWSHRRWGPLSRMYCVSCGKASPYAVSETMIAVFYKCNDCVATYGEPSLAVQLTGAGAP